MRIICGIAASLLVMFAVVPAIVCASSSLTPFPTEAPPSIPEPGRPDRVAAIGAPPRTPEAKERVETIPDPLEPVNRVFFHFNDKLYFWVLKPAATGYQVVFPEPIRVGVKNFFSNITSPIRLVNCLLQGNFKGAGNETIRLALNSTLGLAGFLDPAKKELKIEKQDEDFGQTLGAWGLGPLLYIEWPILGASSVRDSIGYVGDLALDPRTYLIPSVPVNVAVRAYEEVNYTSLTIGEYEDLKKAAVDLYVAKRDAYQQYRQHKIKEKGRTGESAGSSGQPPKPGSAQVAQLDLQNADSDLQSY